MKKQTTKKITTILTAVFLVAVIALSALAINIAEAQIIEEEYPQFLFIGVGPNPVGKGQTVSVVVWTSEIPIAGTDDKENIGQRPAWKGITLNITKPDGTQETVSLPTTDPVGGTYHTFIPDQVGNYTVTAYIPAMWKNSTTRHRLYLADDTEPTIFTVTEEPLTYISNVPFPTEYWTRPIHGFLKGWYQIAGNWLTGGRDRSYVTAPNAAHIMWSTPYFFGGIAGGDTEDVSYYEGTSYETKFGGVSIIGGYVYYTETLSHSSTITKIVCRDLRTGELIWEKNQTSITASLIYHYDAPNQDGNHPYIWASNNVILDPYSGTELFRYTNVPTGTAAVGPNGERLIYAFGGPTTNRTWLAQWNMSTPLTTTNMNANEIAQYRIDKVAVTNYWQWRPVGKVHDGNDGYDWNVTLPPGLETGYTIYALKDRIISGSGFTQYGAAAPHNNFTLWAVSTEPDSAGKLLWQKTFDIPKGSITMKFSSADVDNGLVVVFAKETRQFMGIDINTGKLLWTTEWLDQWMMYSGGSEQAYGNVYATGYGGHVYAINGTTGKLEWTVDVDNEGLESVYERSPLSMTVVDGKIFARSQEHSMTQPYYRTWKNYCFDAYTGDRLWDLAGTGPAAAYSDGYMVYLNYADLQVYCIGKGPTAIKVDASPKIAEDGKAILIEGTLTDISPGTNTYTSNARFPDGVPVIADKDMNRWMEHVYMQLGEPKDASGVDVVISVLDPNGNLKDVATTTSDAKGFFKTTFVPEVPGEYTVIASFKGTDSYWPTQSQTSLFVETANPTTPPQEPTTESFTDMYILGIGAAILIAVIVIGILTLMAVKKRP
ncbi:PQQ-binding-like beta-propeller repeat protein [Candidatus Bathycorpusculum sp.]|jgi:outer membrane protein assembly factor BamB|uniref:outer membrane protein assembly factor BamB family protein n=1 Tax=Candidatus Bathycorpusculum sp. TaxID=2994959 RepID=UPI00281F6313|nr:PQQ-binding-like beta-propeller repeat protein [Candidatus Termitimicrobium sp.]MCL2432327.1 PQQ-binding-like beta-propeller repeat protein [Candidatus Termitimicrobium sp.]